MADQIILPDPRFRSPTAVGDKSDGRDENIYSALVIAHGGAGQQKVFTVPQGQSIPRLTGAGIAPTAAHQLTYTEVTTNLTKAGEAGSAIGDFAVRALGITFEAGWFSPAAAAVNGGLNGNYGMGNQEVFETLSKTFFQLKIAGKKQIEGATFMFPCTGAGYGGISVGGTNANTLIADSLNNGWPGASRKLRLPILVARTDTIEGVFGVAGSSSLVFSVTSGIGQSSLVWFNLISLVGGDVR
jgi:hypothetical protein